MLIEDVNVVVDASLAHLQWVHFFINVHGSYV